MSEQLQASIYQLPEPGGRRRTARDLWGEISQDLTAEFPETYVVHDDRPFRIQLLSEQVSSADRSLVRFRTIDAHIRRRPGHPTLLDVAVGNSFFYSNGTTPPARVHAATLAGYERWTKSASSISLAEHTRLISRFVSDLLCAGWTVESDQCRSIHLPALEISTQRGVRPFPIEKLSLIERMPVRLPPEGLHVHVVAGNKTTSDRAADQLADAFRGLLRGPSVKPPRITSDIRISNTSTNLILLDEQEDLNANRMRRDELRTAEAAGVSFKLSRIRTIAEPYPAQTLAADLFHLAGGRLWLPASCQTPFCSLDAGHDREAGRSRWVKVESGREHEITSVLVRDTTLAEHLPAELLGRFWPCDPKAILCRDGRLAQERDAFESRAAAESRPLIEAKKSPGAVMWCNAGVEITAARAGDALLDSHGELLLQTVSQTGHDYVRPLRLATCGGDPVEVALQFYHQQAMPGLQFFKMSRLPGSLYFADLLSKLTIDGWPKAIGRGFKVPMIIPA